jgi:hypothetical protein
MPDVSREVDGHCRGSQTSPQRASQRKENTTSRWTTGENQVERLLGRELCVFAWAVEVANKDLVPNAIRNWAGFRPEERWWLFAMAANLTGTSGDADIGWRKAIRIALTETLARKSPPSEASVPGC